MNKAFPCPPTGLLVFWLFSLAAQGQSWLDLKKRDFPQAQVVAMEQDKYGFMWFSTSQGLVRWDGDNAKWIRHDPENEQSLSSGNGRTLHAEGEFLWAGFHGGLSQVEVTSGTIVRYSQFQEQESANVWSVFSANPNQTWVGTDQALFLWDGTELELQNIPQEGIPCMAWISEKLWVGTDEHGLWFKDEDWQLVEGTEGIKFRTMIVDKSSLWIGTAGHGLGHIETQTQSLQWFKNEPQNPQSLSHNQINALAKDDKNQLWIGTAQGLCKMDLSTPGTFHPDSTFSEEHIRALFFEPSGILFCATEKPGVWQLDLQQERFHNLDIGQGGAWSHLVQDDVIWVGGKNGLRPLHPNQEQATILQDQTIRDLVSEGDQFWVATDSGLFLGNETFEKKISGVRIWSIEKENETLWLGSDKGVIRYAEQVLEYIDTTKGLSHNIVTSVVFFNGFVWAGTYGGGLNRIDAKNSQIEVFKKDPMNPNSLSANDVVFLFVDLDEQLWVCTLSAGLNRLSESGITRFGVAQGLPDQTTVGMTQDEEGRFWVYSASGLSHFDPTNQTSKTFTHDHGLLTGSALPGGLSFQNKRLYIGGTDGLAWANPDELMIDQTPNAVITNLQLDERNWLAEGNGLIALQQPQKSMVIEMDLLDFRPRKKEHTSYLRQDIDPGFLVGGRASYTQYLPFGGTGRVVFQFRDTYNQLHQKQIHIKVEKPKWVKWAPLWGTFILLGMVFLIYQWSALAFRKKQAKLEAIANFERDRAEVAEKRTELEIKERKIQQDTQRILQDFLEQRLNELANEIHDGPLGKVTGLGFQLNELCNVTDPEQWKREVMALTEKNIPNICKDLRSTCQSLLSPDLSEDFCDGLEDLVEQSLENSNTEPIFDWGSDLDHLSLETKKGLYRIVRTLAQNVARHARAKKVKIGTSSTQNSLIFEMADDGIGFQPPDNLETLKQEGHFGLYLCAAFAKSMGADLQFQSKLGDGFLAQIELPNSARERI